MTEETGYAAVDALSLVMKTGGGIVERRVARPGGGVAEVQVSLLMGGTAAGDCLVGEPERLVLRGRVIDPAGIEGDSNHDHDVEPEELAVKDVASLLGQVVAKDVIAHGKPVRHLYNFEDFCTFMVFPYLLVAGGEDSGSASANQAISEPASVPRFVMFARAVGLLEEPLLASFFGA